MTVPAPRPKRPTLDARLVAWARAYRAILGEMTGDAPALTDLATRGSIVTTAAQVAAQLVTGAELED